MPSDSDKKTLVAHIVWNDKVILDDKKDYIEIMNKQLKTFLPVDVELVAYAEHEIMLPYSPTTLKKDKNKMSKQTTGYIQSIDSKMNNIEFILNDSGKYSQRCAIMDERRIKYLRRK